MDELNATEAFIRTQLKKDMKIETGTTAQKQDANPQPANPLRAPIAGYEIKMSKATKVWTECCKQYRVFYARRKDDQAQVATLNSPSSAE